MKILIVDDDAPTVTTIKAFLAGQDDVQIETALGGQEGLDAMKATPDFDLIILDFMMSTISGMDVCKAMSKDEKLKNIPVLLISALPVISPALHELMEEFHQTGVVKGVLEKPFAMKDLEKEIKLIVKNEE
jgi:CheY-like chemotaxis protein